MKSLIRIFAIITCAIAFCFFLPPFSDTSAQCYCPNGCDGLGNCINQPPAANPFVLRGGIRTDSNEVVSGIGPTCTTGIPGASLTGTGWDSLGIRCPSGQIRGRSGGGDRQVRLNPPPNYECVSWRSQGGDCTLPECRKSGTGCTATVRMHSNLPGVINTVDFVVRRLDLPPVGSFDSATCINEQARYSGWACDPDNVNQRLVIELWNGVKNQAGSTLIESFGTNTSRPDIAANCGGNPDHGFTMPLSDDYIDGQTRSLNAYAMGIGTVTPLEDTLLIGSPRTFTCTPGAWYRLRDASLNKVGSIDNFVPVINNAFDSDDNTNRYVMKGNAGVALSESTIFTGSSVSISAKNNYKSTYQFEGWQGFNFLEYVRQRKKFKIVTAFNEIESNTINIWYTQNLVISNPGSFPPNIENAVLIVSGNITFDNPLNTFNPSGRSLALIASQINIHSSVKELNGIFMANTIDLSYDQTSTEPLKIMGNLISLTDIEPLKRQRTDFDKPSLFVVFNPKMYLDLLPYLSLTIQEGRQLQ